MKSVTPPAPRHLTSRKFVHDNDLTVLTDDVLLILMKQRVRFQQLVDDMNLLTLVSILSLERLHTLSLLVDRQR